MEELRSARDAAREEADRARTKLAEAAAREAEHARRFGQVHEELAEARAEIAALHRRLEHSEALRAELAGRLFEAGAREDTAELVRLRRQAGAREQQALVNERAITRLRERVEELVASRDTLLARVAEWQQLVRDDGPEAADLSEFLAELRREILDMEHRDLVSEAREAALRERLALAGIDPDQAVPEDAAPEPAASGEAGPEGVASEGARPESAGPEDAAPDESTPEEPAPAAVAPEPASGHGHGRPHTRVSDEVDVAEPAEVRADAEGADTEGADSASADADDADAARASVERTDAAPADALVAELEAVGAPARQADLLLRLGRSGDATAVDAVRPWTRSREPAVRAAAYEALGRLLEREPDELEIHLRRGLADADARVRRRVVLAAAGARGLATGPLLEPLREDPDRQVRRLIRQVLRRPAASVRLPFRGFGGAG